MKHYDSTKWKLYTENKLDEHEEEEMQEHLLNCDQCLSLYLSLIDYKINEKSIDETIFPAINFTDSVINALKVDKKKVEEKRQKRNHTNLVVYYVSAASITLFLMGSGVFHQLLNTFSDLSYEVSNTQEIESKLFFSGWTEKLTEGTSNIIHGKKLINSFSKDNK